MTDSNLYQAPNTEILQENGETCDKMHLFSISQRIGRLRYLAYTSGVYWVFAILTSLLMIMGVEFVEIGEQGSFTGLAITIVWYLVLMMFFAFIGVRRLHDLDKSGWYYLLILAPFLNFFFALYMLFAKGTQGKNNYGPKPLPNHLGLWLIGLILPMILFLGIFAAVAIPAYQGYVDQAAEVQMMQDE